MKNLKKPSEAEQMVLSILYGEGQEMTVNEIGEKIKTEYGRKWAQQTTSTNLSRLKKKGYICSRQSGRKVYYTAIVSKEEYAAVLFAEYKLFCRIAGRKEDGSRKKLIWEKPNGEWGLNNFDIKQVPSELYGAICKLRDYERTGITPEQIYELDRLYQEKCREAAVLEKRIRGE